MPLQNWIINADKSHPSIRPSRLLNFRSNVIFSATFAEETFDSVFVCVPFLIISQHRKDLIKTVLTASNTTVRWVFLSLLLLWLWQQCTAHIFMQTSKWAWPWMAFRQEISITVISRKHFPTICLAHSLMGNAMLSQYNSM